MREDTTPATAEPLTRARAQSAKQARPERVFAALLLTFGLVFAVGMPPCQVADESTHFLRAYHVSEGHLFPEMVGEWGGGVLPVSVHRLAKAFGYLPFHPERQAMHETYTRLLATSLEPDNRQPIKYVTGYYSFVPYLPPACGIALARWAGAGPLGIFYAGRLANLALAVLLVYWAIRITPIFKLVLGTVALLPISVHQFASHSVDAPTIAAALLFSAVLFRLAVPRQGSASTGLIAALLSVSAGLTLCKFPYAVLSLSYLGVPIKRLGGLRRYLCVGLCLFLLMGSLSGALIQLRKYTPGYITHASVGASMEKQTHFMRAHPIRYVEIMTATVAERGTIWIDQLAILGWLDTPVNPLAMQLFFLFVALVALGDRTGGITPPTGFKVAGLAAVVLSAGVILTCCYVSGNPLKAKLIEGLQGRYFVPFLPLLLLPLYNRLVEVRTQPGMLLVLTGAACAASLTVAVAAFVRRYYLPVEFETVATSAALAVAVMGFATVVVVSRMWARPTAA
jgi:uncharacterized membrane protein